MVPIKPLAPDQQEEKDTVIRALFEQRRRATLRVLQHHRKASLAEIAKEIAGGENDRVNGAVPSDAVTAVRIDLYHRHIPILVEARLVCYAEASNEVAISEHGTNVTACLEKVLTAPDSGDS